MSPSSTANMVKFFSVDWLARSHHDAASSEEHGDGTDTAPSGKPHVPCMVQPRPPAFGKGYVQLKPKTSKAAEPAESSGHQGASPCALLHRNSCASPSLEVSGYSSGYESEAASSECPSVDEGSEGEKDGPQRRARTKFTPEQIGKLEKIFNKHKYLDAGERMKTAQKLNLTETQVRTWFQNRRMKLKREVQDYLAPQVPALMFQPVAPVQYHSVGRPHAHFPVGDPAFYPLPVPQMVFQQQHQQQLPPPPHLMIQNQHFY